MRAPKLIVPVVAAATLLAGCAIFDDEPAEDGESGDEQGDEPKASPGASKTANGGQAGSSVGVADVDPDDVLAEQTFTLPGTDDEVDVGVISLQVDDETMTLQLSYTPEFSSASSNDTISVWDMRGAGDGGGKPTFIDRENLKEYSLIEDGPDKWQADEVHTETTNGEPVVWWGVYPAPEDEVDTFDLRILPNVPEFTDVPVQQ